MYVHFEAKLVFKTKLPKSWANLPCDKIVEVLPRTSSEQLLSQLCMQLFMEHYDKKNPDHELASEALLLTELKRCPGTHHPAIS